MNYFDFFRRYFLTGNFASPKPKCLGFPKSLVMNSVALPLPGRLAGLVIIRGFSVFVIQRKRHQAFAMICAVDLSAFLSLDPALLIFGGALPRGVVVARRVARLRGTAILEEIGAAAWTFKCSR